MSGFLATCKLTKLYRLSIQIGLTFLQCSFKVAGFYAKMLDHDYTSKQIFNDNFFEDWRKEMADEERELIEHLTQCDFKEIHAYYTQVNISIVPQEFSKDRCVLI